MSLICRQNVLGDICDDYPANPLPPKDLPDVDWQGRFLGSDYTGQRPTLSNTCLMAIANPQLPSDMYLRLGLLEK